MNHVPFVGAKYLQSHPFRPARSFVEHYLNSVSEQDHCLLEFWRRFRQLGRDDVHLFIMPDHSVGVVGIPPRPDGNFAVWLAYVPPARQATVRAARLVHSPVPSQAQIYPTVLELLGAPRSPRSFAFALRGEPAPGRYDDCHMLSRGGNALVVRRNGQRFAYRLDTREVTDGQGGREKMSLGEFQERYACGRG